jgi:hypothetical protein
MRTGELQSESRTTKKIETNGNIEKGQLEEETAAGLRQEIELLTGDVHRIAPIKKGHLTIVKEGQI